MIDLSFLPRRIEINSYTFEEFTEEGSWKASTYVTAIVTNHDGLQHDVVVKGDDPGWNGYQFFVTIAGWYNSYHNRETCSCR